MGIPLAQAIRHSSVDTNSNQHESAHLMIGVPISRMVSTYRKSSRHKNLSAPAAAGVPLSRCSKGYNVRGKALLEHEKAGTSHIILPAAAAVGVTSIIGLGTGGALVAKSGVAVVSAATALVVGGMLAL